MASLAFPLISAGIYGWPKDDAVDAAVSTILEASTRVADVRLVAFDPTMFHFVQERIARA